MSTEPTMLKEGENYFRVSWKNGETTLQFWKDRVVVHLFVDNVCVDKKEIFYSEVVVFESKKETDKSTLLPNGMELGKTYKFVYGVQADLVIREVELTDEEKRTCRSCKVVADELEHLDDAGFCEICRQGQRR